MRKRVKYAHVWPIDERAAKPPEGWTGWPDGKKFALVLTHDVETVKGVERVTRVAELEKGLGFRSSFNFIAEEYPVPHDQIKYLKDEGFEVGLHGLNHNGNLFESKKKFQKQAPRINQYLKDWGVAGFRTPIMYHNLEWIHDLNIEYDSSTFDTDPFEPQPDGMGTIFPFWVPLNPQHPTLNTELKDSRLNTQHLTLNTGYIELPYTLPQDFTLFVLMGERDIDIWKKKVDWIAEHGGMVLLITHPDYMDLENNNPKSKEYSARYYEELLSYIKQKYDGQYWHVMPKEIAKFWAKDVQVKRNVQISPYSLMREKHILFIVENQVAPYDIRVWSEALVAKEFGLDVTIISPKNQRAPEKITQKDGIEIYRHPTLCKSNRKLEFILEYLNAMFWEVLLCLQIFIKKPFQIIHAANPPDHIFMVASFFKLFGVKFIFDHHDLTPELYKVRFFRGSKLTYNILLLLEKLSCKAANVIISTNESYKKIIMKRHNINPGKIFIVRNDPPIKLNIITNIKDGMNNNGRMVLLYLGSINPQDGLDILIQSLDHLVHALKVENFICKIVGDGESLESVKRTAADLRLESYIEFEGYILERKIVEKYISLADICVEPAPDNELNRHSTFIKIMEYMAAGKPVVAFNLLENRNSLDGSGILVEPGDVVGFAKAIKRLVDEPDLREKLGRIGLNRIKEELNWEKASLKLKEAYEWVLK